MTLSRTPFLHHAAVTTSQCRLCPRSASSPDACPPGVADDRPPGSRRWQSVRRDHGYRYPRHPSCALDFITGSRLSTALSLFALRRLLGAPTAVSRLYFDPDIGLFSRVDDILATLEASNVALTPHQTQPEKTLENVIDNEITSLMMGVFNLGFIGVANTAEGHRFAQWWSERTYHFCRAEVANGLFTDQKWINFAPSSSRGRDLSPRAKTATWNITRNTPATCATDSGGRRAARLSTTHRFDEAPRLMALRTRRQRGVEESSRYRGRPASSGDR